MRDDEDHDELVAALQDVMLPAGIPVFPDIDLAARYCLPGSAEEAIGNWFDVVTLSDGRLGLVVGEAVGTGMAAAAAMGQVRAVLRAGLEMHEDVVTALELADVFARTSDDARGTAVVAAVLDPAAGTVTYATAAHPAPVVSTPGRPATELDRSATGWLGAGDSYAATRAEVGRGDLLLLTCAASHRGLATVPEVVDAHREVGDAETTCGRLAEALYVGGDEALTLLAAEVRVEPRGDLTLDLPVGELTTRTARERLRGWLDQVEAPPMDALAILHAPAELIANATEHAHAGPHDTTSGDPEPVHLHARLDAEGVVHVEVSDHGTWRESSDDDIARGRGLAMAAGLVDGLSIVTSEAGTTAAVRHRLCRPVHIDHGPTGATRLPLASVQVSRDGPGLVRLTGTFGHDDIDRVSAELLLASQGGTREVRVDLAQVTHLASTAVRMLGDLVTDATSAPVVLVAPADTTAQRALDVARVAHDAA